MTGADKDAAEASSLYSQALTLAVPLLGLNTLQVFFRGLFDLIT